MAFESDYKQQKLKQAQIAESKSILILKTDNINNNISVDNLKSSENYKSNDVVDHSTKNSSKNSIKVDDQRLKESPKENNIMNISKDKVIKESLNQQKAYQIDKIINDKQNDFSLFESNKDSLFDKVLNQVQEKNKSKKKKNKKDIISFKDMSGILDINNNSYMTNPTSNKIVLVAERPKDEKREEEIFEQKKKKGEKTPEKTQEKKLDQNNFSILNEIFDFEHKITEIEKSNKKFNENKKNSVKMEDPAFKNVVPSIVIPQKTDNKKIINSGYKKDNEDTNDFNLLYNDKFNGKDMDRELFKNDNDYKLLSTKSNQKQGNDNEMYRKNLMAEKNTKDVKKKMNFIENEDEGDLYLEGISSNKDDKSKNKQNPIKNLSNNTNINNKKNYEQEKETNNRSEHNEKLNKSNYNNKPKSLLDKDKAKKYNNNNNYDMNLDRQKNVDKE